MPLVLRKLRKAKWYKNSNVEWLKEGELQADALGDLGTQANALSVWYIEDNMSNLERVIAALASMNDSISNFDYALVELQILDDVGIQCIAANGETSDETANGWHRDAWELTAAKVFDLALAIQAQSQEVIKREPDKKVRNWIIQGVTSQHIDVAKMNQELRKKLDV